MATMYTVFLVILFKGLLHMDAFLLVTEIYDNEKVLLYKNTSKETFVIGSEFVPADGSSDFLDIAFRSSCHPSYYGNGCQRYCKASFTYTCDAEGRRVCHKGWSGEQCDTPICRDGCKHGRCVEPDRCECDHGFFGPKCEDCRRSENCRHGRCRDDQPFTCACESGWGGIYCDRDLEYCTRHHPCKNGGVCTNGGVKADFTCRCSEGFTGSTCDVTVPSICQHSGICRNGGVCTTVDTKLGRCECATGFEGRYCERRLAAEQCASNVCRNGGSCIAGLSCACPQCFSGSDCSTVDEKCLWQRVTNATQNGTDTQQKEDGAHTTILMLMALASILMLATCVVVFFMKYKRMQRLLRDPVTQNAINEHRHQILELPKKSIEFRPPDEAYKVFVIPSKKCKEFDDDVKSDKRYASQPLRGRYRNLPFVDVVAVSMAAASGIVAAAEPEHHYAEIEFRPTTVSLDDKRFAEKACVV